MVIGKYTVMWIILVFEGFKWSQFSYSSIKPILIIMNAFLAICLYI